MPAAHEEMTAALSAAGMPLPHAAEISAALLSSENDRMRIDMAYLEPCPGACRIIADGIVKSPKKKLYLTLHNYRMRETFAQREDVSVLLKAAKESAVTSVALRGVYPGSAGYAALNDTLTNGGITALRLETSDLAEHADLFAAALEDTLLTSLELQANQLDDASLRTAGEAIGRLTQLEYLDIGRNAYLAGFESLLTRLPETLTSLNLAETQSPHRDMDFLAERLTHLHVLTHLNLSLCRLSEESILLLAAVLPKTNLIHLDLSYNPLTPAGIKALIGALSHPKSIIYETGLTGDKSELPPQAKAAIEQLEKANRAKIDTVYAEQIKEHLELQSALRNTAEIEAAVRRAQDIRELKESGLLFAAAKAGKIRAVYERLDELHQHLRPEDYFLTDRFGKTLLSLVGNAKQLAVVFAPGHWQNPHLMQSVFDSLPQRQKVQLDGKKGRPDFQDMKNAAMKNSANSLRQPYFP